MDQDRFWELLSLKLSGEASTAELRELDEILQEQPELSYRAGIFATIWNNKQEEAADRNSQFNRHMQRLSNHLSDPVLQYGDDGSADNLASVVKLTHSSRKTRNRVLALMLAASVIIAFILFVPLNQNKNGTGLHAHNTISTKRGSKSKIILPDGTQVWLNADSKIKYDENFQGKFREVELSGEAFFEVTRDESRPFIIHTATIDLKVLGTAFNLRSYAEELNTETSLIHGSVEVTLLKSPDRKKIILKPNDKLIVSNASPSESGAKQKENTTVMTLGKINVKGNDSLPSETLWTRNQLVFDNESLEDIAGKIERWYDVKVNIMNEKLKKEAYTATFDNIPLRDVMEALKRGGGFRYTITNKEVTIYPG